MVKVTVKKIHAVAKWKWLGTSEDNVCAICNNSFESTCADCHTHGYSCPPAFGTCGHSFHLHCMEKWASKQNNTITCPYCRSEWVYKTC